MCLVTYTTMYFILNEKPINRIQAKYATKIPQNFAMFFGKLLILCWFLLSCVNVEMNA